jgi:hypothetical protein
MGSLLVAAINDKTANFAKAKMLGRNFSLAPGFSRVRKVGEEKKAFKRFFFGAFMVYRVNTRRS